MIVPKTLYFRKKGSRAAVSGKRCHGRFRLRLSGQKHADRNQLSRILVPFGCGNLDSARMDSTMALQWSDIRGPAASTMRVRDLIHRAAAVPFGPSRPSARCCKHTPNLRDDTRRGPHVEGMPRRQAKCIQPAVDVEVPSATTAEPEDQGARRQPSSA